MSTLGSRKKLKARAAQVAATAAGEGSRQTELAGGGNQRRIDKSHRRRAGIEAKTDLVGTTVGTKITGMKMRTQAVLGHVKEGGQLQASVQSKTMVQRQQSPDLNQIYQVIPFGICCFDPDLRFVHINEWLATINRLAVQQHIGQRIGQVLPDLAMSIEPLLRQVLETGEPVLDGAVEHDATAHPRFKRVFQYNLYPVTSGDDTVLGVTCVVQDVTERKQTRELLRRREGEIAHVERLHGMGQIVAEISHEVGQPLFSISNFAKASINVLTARDHGDDQQLIDWMRRIDDIAMTAGEILRRVREFLIDKDGARSTLEMNEAIADSIKLLSLDSHFRHVTFQVDPPLTRNVVCANRAQVQQVLVNLIKNACEAMEGSVDGDPCIVVRASTDGRYVETTIEDNGPGVSGEAADRLFDAFYSTKRKGMGMGLAVCRSIIESHGGTIGTLPNSGGGAVFRFSLPHADGDESNES